MQEVPCNLSSCFLCSHCLPEWRQIIGLKKKTFVFKKGRSLFSEGDPVKGIFFLYSGAVKVHMHWPEDKELILRFAKAGDIVGHRGLASHTLYPISATALTDTMACFIANDFLETTLKTNHQFTYELMHFYAQELQKAETRMRNLTHMEVKGRIAEALLDIAGLFGVNEEGFIDIALSRQDLASYAGTTYETVFKFMAELTQAEIVLTKGKSIKINQPERLRSYIRYPK